MPVAAQNNFLIPNATILVEAVLFFILLGVLAKWVLPPVSRAIAERQEVIRRRLVEAEEAKKSLASAEADYRKALAEARHEAALIREQARERGAAIVADARRQAQEEANAILAEARSRIEADREAAASQLRAEIGGLATELASRVVGEPVTGDAAEIDRFLAESDRVRAE